MGKVLGVQIGDKHTLKDWNLGWTSINLGFPEAKTYEQEIPGADGSLDLTDAICAGDVKYKNRSLSLEFEAPDRDFFEWASLTSEIANYLVGKRLKIILDTDPDYYYIGRLKLDTEKTDRELSVITLSGDVDPYKLELHSGAEDWLWDSFSFETGIVREYKDIKVNGEYELNIIGRRKRVIPTFICSEPTEVEYLGKTYSLSTGKSKVFDIWTTEGDNILKLRGNGIVTIDYRGGSL